MLIAEARFRTALGAWGNEIEIVAMEDALSGLPKPNTQKAAKAAED